MLHYITLQDSSEPAIPVDEILSRLEELDKQLQTLEAEGRELEEKIRSGKAVHLFCLARTGMKHLKRSFTKAIKY